MFIKKSGQNNKILKIKKIKLTFFFYVIKKSNIF